MKKLTHWTVATVLFGSVLTSSAHAADSLSVLLQKGIYAEETEGNVDAAIKIYEQIAAETASNRTVIAQAQYRLAVCYQKKGNKEQAVSLLSALLKQSPTEATLGIQARQRLTEMGQAPSETITVRKISTPRADGLWAISPDSRLLAYSPYGDDTDMAMVDLTSGKSWIVVKQKGNDSIWDGVAFSPDSQRVAYDLGGTKLYVSNIDGTELKQVFKSEKADGNEEYLEVIGWTPTGGQLIVGRGEKDPNQDSVGTLDLQTAMFKELKRIPRLEHKGNSRLTPDGRYLAFREGDVPRRKISIVDLESGQEATLVEHEVDSILGWSPDATKLLFLSERSGTTGVWAISVRDGKPVGSPQLVKSDLGGVAVSDALISRRGDIYYAERRSSVNVFVATADFKTGIISSEPRVASERFPGQQIHPTWSKDGDQLMLDIWQAKKRFISVSMTSDEQREYPAEQAFSGWLQQFSWAEAGGFVLVMGVRAGGDSGIHRFDLTSGKIETLVSQDFGKTWNCMPTVTPDGTSFYYLHREFSPGTWTDRILRRDLRSGKEETVYGPAEKLNNWSSLALSPDGSRLAFVTSDQTFKGPAEGFVAGIKILNVNGATSKELVRLAPKTNISTLAWTPDGKRIVYNKVQPGTNEVRIGQNEVWSMDVESGQSVQLKFPQAGIRGLAINPDGQRIAFSAGSRMEGVDLWVVEGLLAESVTQK